MIVHYARLFCSLRRAMLIIISCCLLHCACAPIPSINPKDNIVTADIIDLVIEDKEQKIEFTRNEIACLESLQLNNVINLSVDIGIATAIRRMQFQFACGCGRYTHGQITTFNISSYIGYRLHKAMAMYLLTKYIFSQNKLHKMIGAHCDCFIHKNIAIGLSGGINIFQTNKCYTLTISLTFYRNLSTQNNSKIFVSPAVTFITNKRAL